MIYNTVIIGGGISGLSLAYFLKKNNVQTVILEQKDTVGGILQETPFMGFNLEHAAFSIRFSPQDKILIQMIEDLNLTKELKLPQEKLKKFFLLNNKLWTPNGLAQSLQSPYIRTTLWQILLKAFSKHKDIDNDISLEEFTIEFLGKNSLPFVSALCNGIWGTPFKETSLECTFKKVYESIKSKKNLYTSIIRSSKSKSKIEHTQGFPKNPGPITFNLGISQITHQLKSYLGNIQLNQKIKSITWDSDSSLWFLQTNQNKTIKARFIIPTIPAHQLQNILSLNTPSLIKIQQNLCKIEYQNILVQHLIFPKNTLHLKAFGYLIPDQEKQPILGCIFPSTVFPNKNPHQLLTTISRAQNIDIKNFSSERVLQKHLSIKNSCIDIKNFHHPKALPFFKVGFQKIRDEINKICEPYPIRILGNYMSGSGITDILKDNLNQANKLKKKLSTT